MIINEYVKDFRGRSFYMENELICGMIMFFFKHLYLDGYH